MFGFLIGTASLIGLIYVLKGGGCGHRGFHRHWHGGRRHRGWGWGYGGWLDGLFDRLDSNRDQEREMRAALDELFDAGRAFRQDIFATREDVARAMRGESFDETLMGDVLSRQDDALDKLKKSMVGTLAKFHAVLDERQRARLADLIASGPRWGFGGGRSTHSRV
jgi:Spy/CpxP family protein refolding chaperone